MYMVTYSAKATASASVVAQFFFRKEETVTATASATAESNVSEGAAYNIALQIAQENANSAAQNDANVIIQSVNTSTLGDNTIFLSSSLLKEYFIRDGNNYTLTSNLELPNVLSLQIGPQETLTIGPNINMNATFRNYGTVIQESGSSVRVEGVNPINSKLFSKNNLTKNFNKANTMNTSNEKDYLNNPLKPVNFYKYIVRNGATFNVTYNDNSSISFLNRQFFTVEQGGSLNFYAGGTFINSTIPFEDMAPIAAILYMYGTIYYQGGNSNTPNIIYNSTSEDGPYSFTCIFNTANINYDTSIDSYFKIINYAFYRKQYYYKSYLCIESGYDLNISNQNFTISTQIYTYTDPTTGQVSTVDFNASSTVTENTFPYGYTASFDGITNYIPNIGLGTATITGGNWEKYVDPN